MTYPAYIHPSVASRDTTRVKRVSEMTTTELKERANQEAVTYYRQQMERNPLNPQARYEYEQACYRAGQAPNPEINRLQTLSREELAAEWTTKGKAVEDAGQETYRVQQAKTWLASQPAYEPTPESAQKLFNEVHARGFKGSVYELQAAFDALVARGEITPKENIQPVRLPSLADARTMPLADLRKLADEAGF